MNHFKRRMLNWLLFRMFPHFSNHGIKRGNGCKGRFRHWKRMKKSLLEAREGERVRIIFNMNKQIINMGMCLGTEIYIIKNHENDINMVVGLENSRFMISKEIAKKIMVI